MHSLPPLSPPRDIGRWLTWAATELNQIEDGRTISLILLSFCFDARKEWLLAHPEATVPEAVAARFTEMVARAAIGEPLAYLLQGREFYGRWFYVDKRVLIPRPETEQLVEAARLYMQDQTIEQPVLVDVGTGSGCIALSLAHLFPQARVYGIDVSPEALAVAHLNQDRLVAGNVAWLLGSLLEPLQDAIAPHSVDVVVANLPYISDAEIPGLPIGVRRHEPALALMSGSDPDVLNRQLVAQAVHWLKPGGFLAYETTNGRIVTQSELPSF